MSEFAKAVPMDGSQKEILLLELDPFFRRLIKGYLEADGYRVITAENGQIGLDRIKESEFDLIISDLEMPIMDGWEFMKNVRQGTYQQDIPALALTVLDNEADRKRAVECGFDGCEVKLNRKRFLASVAELLGAKKG
jgi:two-component system chemotaxis sensor kinase CheA